MSPTGAIGATLAWMALLAAAATPPAQAGEPARDAAIEGCEGEARDRLRLLQGRLERDRRYADLWWKGWNAVFVGGIGVQGTRAGLADDRGERADRIVGAVKSGIGLARNLLSPPPARRGADELEALSPAPPCAQRLARAEALLRRNAESAHDERRSWAPHLANLGLNLVGALVVAKGFDEPAGWVSGALGFAVGEARIWSYPWQAAGAWEEYERRFPPSGLPQTPPTTWRFEPWGAGARVTLHY